MSIPFSDTAAKKGLVQLFEKEIGASYGDISGNTDKLKGYTADANLALDDFWTMAIASDGTWQLDDSNHTDFPIITTGLVSGQRDYTFTTDEGGNLILQVQRVLVADSSGRFHEIDPVDVATQRDTNGFYDGQNLTGTPSRYDKLANGIFLDPIPNYNYANGLKVYINREPSYFTHEDTTKKPGIPGLFHRYLVAKPALDHSRRYSTPNYQALQLEVMQLEKGIKEYFSSRNADERKRFTVSRDSNK